MKKLAAIAITVLMTASSASAQVIVNMSENARMDGMGVANFQIVDDFNIWINPAQINNYKNNVYFEVGEYFSPSAIGAPNQDGIAPASQWGGANIDAGYGTWGLYIGRTYGGALTGFEIEGAGTAPLSNRFDLFYGLAGAPVGVYLSYAKLSEEDKIGGFKETDEAQEINVGVGGIFGPIEGALNISVPSSECKSTQVAPAISGNVPCVVNDLGGWFAANPGDDLKIESDAAPTISLLGRHTLPTPGGNLLSTLALATVDESYKATNISTGAKLEEEITGLQFLLGTAMNATPNPETLFVLGIGVEYLTAEAKVKGVSGKGEITALSVPLNVGVEHQTFSKVKTRFGISKPLHSTAETEDNTTGVKLSHTIEEDGAATVSAGLGFSPVDNVEIDAVLNQDIIFTGGYVVSGVAETLSTKVSATYRFK